ncbi:hypothetical protein, partial [Pseudoalteromonas sp. S1688]|uniref:hypothetical protein n=1 Tax=Pseudoalteromonas sp. S1688 TaxID=579511 RepID=UPI00126F8893
PGDLPLDLLLGKARKLHRDVSSHQVLGKALVVEYICAADASDRLLRLPTIDEKNFLISSCDRSVRGLVASDQMLG